MFYFFYLSLAFLSFPFLKGWMAYRLSKGKEDPCRVGERYGQSLKRRPKGKVYWFHGASIGECLSFFPVLNYFEKHHPTYSFLITSGTRASADLLEKRLSKKCIHQYVPLDHPLFVNRFLSHWKPDACFWTESDFWPNLIIKASRSFPLFLLNGRLSLRSARRWSILTPLIVQVLKAFSVIFPQSFDDFKRFKSLGISHLKMVGNLKYEGEKLRISLDKVHELQKEIRKRPLWIASNTHEGEEKIVLDVHKKLQETISQNLLLILIPRHPHRWTSVEDLVHDY